MEFRIQDIPVYFISTRSNVQRRKQTKSTLLEAGFTNIEWIEGVERKTKVIGCALAHAKALNYALEKNIFPFLIVEDDIVLYEKHEEVKIPDDADALYLGLSEYGLHGGKGVRKHAIERVNAKVFRLHNMLAAHAIVYFNREYVESLLKINSIFVGLGTNQDKGRAETMKYHNVYALSKPMFYQTDRHEEVTKIELPNRYSTSLHFFYRG